MSLIPIDEITKMVVNLREPGPNGDKVGTGTLVVSNNRPFVLTAKLNRPGNRGGWLV